MLPNNFWLSSSMMALDNPEYMLGIKLELGKRDPAGGEGNLLSKDGMTN
jgi:hypothetical protein